MPLDTVGQAVLKQALEEADGKLEHLANAVRAALKGKGGERFGYLYREVIRIAKRRIKDSQRKKPQEFVITPAMRRDAERHERELCRRIPSHDR
jgi:hypothetical protein